MHRIKLKLNRSPNPHIFLCQLNYRKVLYFAIVDDFQSFFHSSKERFIIHQQNFVIPARVCSFQRWLHLVRVKLHSRCEFHVDLCIYRLQLHHIIKRELEPYAKKKIKIGFNFKPHHSFIAEFHIVLSSFVNSHRQRRCFELQKINLI